MREPRDVTICYDAQGSVLAWSGAAERLFGFSSAEMLGTPVTRIVPADRLDEHAELVRELVETRRVVCRDTVRLTRDGRLVEVGLALSPIVRPSGDLAGAAEVLVPLAAPVAGPHAETTETDGRHYLERELLEQVRTNPEIFEFLQSGSLDGLWYWDVERPDQEWMSPRFKEVFGYRDDEVPNTSEWWQENIFPEDRDLALKNFGMHLADPSHPYDQIVRYRHKDGSTKWVRCRGIAIRDATGRAVRMLGAHSDVTAIKRSEERYRALCDGSPDMYFAASPDDVRIFECNGLVSATAGLGPNAVVGRSFYDLCSPASVGEARAAFESLRTTGSVEALEVELRHASGGSVPILLAARAARGADGKIERIDAWGRDIGPLRTLANVEIVLDAMPGGVLLVDADGRVASANAGAQTMFGYDRAEILSASARDLLPGLPDEALASAGSPGVLTSHDVTARRADATVFFAQVGLGSLRTRDGEYAVVSVLDVSRQKAAETAVRESENRFRTLADGLPQLVWTCVGDGSCDYLSARWVEYTGIPEAEQLGSGWLECVHPDDRPALVDAWSSAVASSTEFRAEFRIRRGDGEYRWFDTRAVPLRASDGRVVKWFGSNTDVHDRRLAEEGSLRWKQLFDFAEFGLAIAGDPGPSFLAANPEFARQHGYEVREMERMPVSDVYLPEERDAMRGRIASVLETGHATFEMTRVRKDGSRFPAQVGLTAVRHPDGRPASVLAYSLDITERRRAEDALRESAEQLRRFVDDAPAALAMFDRNMRYLATSRLWVEAFGRGLSELAGLCHYDLFPDLPPEWLDAHARALAGEIVSNDEDTWTASDGSTRWLRWSVHPWRAATGEIGGITMAAEDITERMLAEVKLREEQNRLALVAAASPGVILSFRLRPDGSTSFPYASAAIVDLYGVRPEDIVADATPVFSKIVPEDADLVARTIDESARTMAPWRCEYRVRHPERGEVWVEGQSIPRAEPDGSIIWHGVVTDVTERKRAEAALRASERRLELVIENLAEGLIIAEVDGTLFHWNPAALAMHGFADAASCRRSLEEFASTWRLSTLDGAPIPVEDWPLSRVYRGETVSSEEVGVRRLDTGLDRVFSYSGRLVTGSDGRPLAFLTMTDVTARKRSEEYVRHLGLEMERRVVERTAELAAANRELEAFAYTVSHDLRAPLRAMDGFSRALVEDFGDVLPDEARRYTRVVRDGAERMSTLIDDLLALSRVSRVALSRGIVDMGDLVRASLTELDSERAGRDVEVRLASLPLARGDASLVKQVWLNLLSNALKYTRRTEAAVVEIGAGEEDGVVVYSVRDNGVGFDARYGHKLFRVFQRLHSVEDFEGTGVGLAIVDRIVRRHGGRVWAESELGRGAAFHFTLENRETTPQ